jgi:signal peptidase II
MSQPTDPSPVEASDPAEQPVGPLPTPASATRATHPRFVFFGVVSAVSLLADVATKAWAEVALGVHAGLDPSIVLVKEHLTLTLAYNKGGAWGLLQDSSETLRRPFFLLVSVLAIAFIVSLYSRLTPGQRALKWGLPLVLGGALGNLQDRIVRSSVIDFIDYRADWVRSMNTLFARLSSHWNVTDHWPTYNVADICICIGVGLMAVDMLTSRRPHAPTPEQPV